jgi:hypothetical protein
LISGTNVVVSGRWSNGSDLLFRTAEWKPISVWTGCGTAFFCAGVRRQARRPGALARNSFAVAAAPYCSGENFTGTMILDS